MIRRPKDRCPCCDGTGTVPDSNGQPRPCSRCDINGFNAWAKDRREAAAAPRAPAPASERAG